MTLGTKHFSSSSVKHPFPSQSSGFNHRSGKHPWTLFWCSVTVLTKQYGRRYRSYILDKILVFAQIEQNLRQVWRVRVRSRRRDLTKLWKRRKLCPGWILRQVRKGFTVYITIQISVRVKGSMNDLWRWFFLESKLTLAKRKAWRLN